MCSHEGGSAHAGELVLQGCGEQRAARSSAISSYSRSLSQGGYGCNGYECMNTARGSTLDARCCMLLAGALVNGLIGYALDVVSSCIMGSSNEKSCELPNSRRLYFSHIYHAYLLHDHFTIGTHLHPPRHSGGQAALAQSSPWVAETEGEALRQRPPHRCPAHLHARRVQRRPIPPRHWVHLVARGDGLLRFRIHIGFSPRWLNGRVLQVIRTWWRALRLRLCWQWPIEAWSGRCAA